MAEEAPQITLPEKSSDDENTAEKNKLDALVSDLAQDYSKYLKVTVASEVSVNTLYIL